MEIRNYVRTRACAILAGSIFGLTWTAIGVAAAPTPSIVVESFQSNAASDLLLLGPVDMVEPSNFRVHVLGQWIAVSKGQISGSLDGTIGHVVAAYGSIAANGSLDVTAIREQTSISYVPGATQLYLKGSISSVDHLRGTAQIGSLSINYLNALHTLDADDLAVGAVVSFGGVQFAEANRFYADRGLVHLIAGQTGSGIVIAPAGQTGSG